MLDTILQTCFMSKSCNNMRFVRQYKWLFWDRAHLVVIDFKTQRHSLVVVDFKTKEFDESKPPDTWDEHALQLAAYREGFEMPSARCAIVYVSVSVPGLAVVRELPEEDLERGWRMFVALLTYWKAKNRV